MEQDSKEKAVKDILTGLRLRRPADQPAGDATLKQKVAETGATKDHSENTKNIESIPPLRLDFESLLALSEKQELETCESYEASLNGAIEALKDTKGIIELKNKNVPTIVISDLHARRDFLMEVLSQQDKDGQSVFDLLEKGKINVVCLGDGMHSEIGKNWYIGINQEFIEKDGKKYPKNTIADMNEYEKVMKEEMVRSLGTMKTVMELKSAFPDSFHYVRGNHDDINETIYKFLKFFKESEIEGIGGESGLVKKWIFEHFGLNFLEKWAKFESMLPLVVKGKDFVASHAAPLKKGVLSMEDIEEKTQKANEQLLWTDNRGIIGKKHFYPEFAQTRKNIGAENSIWIIGHRPVDGKFRRQFDGELIQINHSKDQLVAIFSPDSSFDPEKNIFDLTKENIDGLGGGQNINDSAASRNPEIGFNPEQQKIEELQKILIEKFPTDKMNFIVRFEMFSKGLLENIEKNCEEYLGKNIPDGEKKSFSLTILKTEIAKKYSEHARSIGLPPDLAAEIAEYITLRIKEI